MANFGWAMKFKIIDRAAHYLSKQVDDVCDLICMLLSTSNPK